MGALALIKEEGARPVSEDRPNDEESVNEDEDDDEGDEALLVLPSRPRTECSRPDSLNISTSI
jgi:hypothetical protein